MTDRYPFDVAPRADFADRLERDVLRVIGDRALAHTELTVLPESEEHLMTIVTRSTIDRPRRTRLISVCATAAAAIALIAGLAWVVTRDTDQEATTAPTVSFTVTWAYSDIITECPEEGHDICLNHFEFPATAGLSGAVEGLGNQVVLWNPPADYPGRRVDHLEHVATYNVDATVAGCGKGQFMLVEIMQFVSGEDRDRDTGTYIGTWQIVPESGRGALSTIAGSGTSTGLWRTAGDVGREFTGSITCL